MISLIVKDGYKQKCVETVKKIIISEKLRRHTASKGVNAAGRGLLVSRLWFSYATGRGGVLFLTVFNDY